MEKIVLKDISNNEFLKIKEILSDYSSETKEEIIDRIKSAIFAASISGSITIEMSGKEDFRILIILIDFYNIWKTDNLQRGWNGEVEEIYNKLTKKFIRLYKEQPYRD